MKNNSNNNEYFFELREGYLFLSFKGGLWKKFDSTHKEGRVRWCNRITNKEVKFLLKMGFLEDIDRENSCSLTNFLAQVEVAKRIGCPVYERRSEFLGDWSSLKIDTGPWTAVGVKVGCQKDATAAMIVAAGGVIISDDRGSCPSGPTGRIELSLPKCSILMGMEVGVKTYEIPGKIRIEHSKGGSSSLSTCRIFRQWEAVEKV